MEKEDYLAKIAELANQVETMPKGYVSKKIINDKVYFYHQWSENRKKQSRYVRDEELEDLVAKIEKRKMLKSQIKEIKDEMIKNTEETKSNTLFCTLMHKRTLVVDLELDNNSGTILRIGKVYSNEHIPVGVSIKDGIPDKKALNDWWTERSIPSSRSGVREALDNLEIGDSKMLLIHCNGLSLSDQYWISPKKNPLTWDEINYFSNKFSEDIGDILFGGNKANNLLDLSSPDNTSDGNLKKRWRIIDGKRCLVKGGSNPYRQQPLNEVIATEIMKRLNINCVSYSVIWDKGVPYSVCEDFVDENTELVPAWRIIQTQRKPNDVSMFQHFVNCAKALGIDDAEQFLNKMIVLDYIIANEDRHLNNFGALRNAETLEWIGMAPIYDSGSSLGYDKIPSIMNIRDEVICKPFKKHHDEQLKLVSSFDWIDFNAISDIKEFIICTLSEKNAREYMDNERIQVIANLTEKRIKEVKAFAMNNKNSSNDSLEDEVTKNIAAKY